MRVGTAAHSHASQATGSRSIDRLTAATVGCSSACAATSREAPWTGAHAGSPVWQPIGLAAVERRAFAATTPRPSLVDALAPAANLSHTGRHCDNRRGDDAGEHERTNQGPRPGSRDPHQREHDDRLDGPQGDEDQNCGLGALHLAGHAIQRAPAPPGAITTSGGRLTRRVARARPSVNGADAVTARGPRSAAGEVSRPACGHRQPAGASARRSIPPSPRWLDPARPQVDLGGAGRYIHPNHR